MAQVKISALPQQTSTTILDVLAIVDSGSTQTSKITLSDVRGLTNGTGASSLVSSSGLTSSASVSSGIDSIAIGNGVTSSGTSGSTAVGGFSVASGDKSTAIGFGVNATANQSVGIGYQVLAEGNDCVAIGSNSKNRGSDSVVIGPNAILNSNSAVCIGKNAQGSEQNISIGYNIINYAQQSIAIGTAVQHQGTNTGGITIGYANDNLDSGGYNVLMGYDRTMRARNSVWIGTNSGIWVDYFSGSTMVGGEHNTMSGYTSSVIGGSGNTLSRDVSVILNGSGTTVSHQGAAMINTFDRTSLYTNTTHVENIHTYLTETFDVVDAGSVGGSINVDCSLGTIFKFTLTADTTPNFINVRTGQRFIFIVSNTTWAVPGATVNGVSSTVYAKNGTINPSNNAITKYTATYDGTYMYLDEELNFTAV